MSPRRSRAMRKGGSRVMLTPVEIMDRMRGMERRRMGGWVDVDGWLVNWERG